MRRPAMPVVVGFWRSVLPDELDVTIGATWRRVSWAVARIGEPSTRNIV